jgi:acetoin utilization protein AcuB
LIIQDILVPGLTTISHNASMLEAQKLMEEKKFRHLPVSDGDTLVGILSDRDIYFAAVQSANGDQEIGHIHPHKLVHDFMSSPVLKAKSTDAIERVVRDMLDERVSCFVIEDQDGKDIGIITVEDVLIAFLDVLSKSHSFIEKFKSAFQRNHSSN